MGALWLIPTLPLASALLLALWPARDRLVAWLGAGSIGLAALVTLGVGIAFANAPADVMRFEQTLWHWMAIGALEASITLHLDALSVTMMSVITGVGFLIHLYATEYMAGDPDYRRFFATMNLFVAFMLLLVLADDLVLLYLGWEGVGLCSYLLIGFWYADADNGAAARKAFIVTRVGDAAMALGLFLLFAQLGTLEIETLTTRANERWATGDPAVTLAAFLLLGGAAGKSAQVPLQTWLPDAMAGPTPVSALIHAATMVTAGVYLIARLHPIYALAPLALTAVAVVGAVTLLVAGVAALAQRDMKRILAYSTISQIGYMFLALGVGAWSAGIFHLVTHAFFKAVLFMAAGAVMLRLHHEVDIFRMGGLRRVLPAAFWAMLAGGAALAALPLVTAGFYSKDAILLAAWQMGTPKVDGFWLWLAGSVGALLTSVYIFRLIFIAFFGTPQRQAEPGTEHSWRVLVPLGVLGVLSLVGGFIPLHLAGVLPSGHAHHEGTTAFVLQLTAAAIAIGGLVLAWVLYGLRRITQPGDGALARFAYAGCGFDALYDRVLVRPVMGMARANRNDALDDVFTGVAALSRGAHRVLSASQSGRLRWYAGVAVAGGVVLLLIAGAG